MKTITLYKKEPHEVSILSPLHLFLRFQTKHHHTVGFGHQVTRKLWMQKVHRESNSIWNSIDYANSHRVEGTAGLEWERSWISIPFIIWNQGSRCDFNYTRGVSDSLSLLANIIYAGDGSSLISAFSSDSALLAGFHLTKPFINILSVPLLLFIYLFASILGDLKHTAHQKPTCASVQCAQAVKSTAEKIFIFLFRGAALSNGK